MPLDEREQRILDEIERQFRKEDPDLVERVNTMPLAKLRSGGVRLAIAGVVLGLVLMLATFSISPFPAVIGFIIMVYSVTRLVSSLSERPSRGSAEEAASSDGSEGRWNRFWPFRR
jgi:hypothetical protein